MVFRMPARIVRLAILVLCCALPLAAGEQYLYLLILPLENSGGDPRLDWVGEGLVALSRERLAGNGRAVFSREEWLGALEKMGLPSSSRFSRATMLKIAEETDADYLVFGSYTSDSKTLMVSVRVLRMEPLGLSPPLVESGPMEEVLDIHARMAWQVVNFVGSVAAVDRSAFLASLPRVRPDAFEQYARGLACSNEAQRLRFFREAARLEPDWDAPAFLLGQAYFLRRDCANALPWFSRLRLGERHGPQAAFYAGVCHLLGNDPARAEAVFAEIAERLFGEESARAGPAEVLNDLGVARARQENWRGATAAWEKARELEPGEADYSFNLGLTALHISDPAGAAHWFREALERQPDDAEARASLAACEGEERAGARLSASLAPRIKTKPSGLLIAERSPRATASARRAAHMQLHLDRGGELLRTGKLAEAERDFSEAVLIAPESAEAHMGLAEAYRRQGRTDDAIRELRAAAWARQVAAPRIALARLFIARKQFAEARAELRAALRMEQDNREARQLLDDLEVNLDPGGRR
jgi:Flp pilus assembly protein TadD/TolB-like protein